jgi:hypothetical protein
MDAAGPAIVVAVDRPLWDFPLFWPSLTLLAVLILGAVILGWISRWRKRSGPEQLSPEDQLSNFHELYERGELSQKEFDRLRALLSEPGRQAFHAPAPSSGATAEPKHGLPRSVLSAPDAAEGGGQEKKADPDQPSA